MSEYKVRHNEEETEFFIALNDGDKAYIRYKLNESWEDKAAVDFYTTFVPDAYRGKKLAALLVNAAFAWADENHYEITASCWYAELKLQKRGNG